MLQVTAIDEDGGTWGRLQYYLTAHPIGAYHSSKPSKRDRQLAGKNKRNTDLKNKPSSDIMLSDNTESLQHKSDKFVKNKQSVVDKNERNTRLKMERALDYDDRSSVLKISDTKYNLKPVSLDNHMMSDQASLSPRNREFTHNLDNQDDQVGHRYSNKEYTQNRYSNREYTQSSDNHDMSDQEVNSHRNFNKQYTQSSNNHENSDQVVHSHSNFNRQYTQNSDHHLISDQEGHSHNNIRDNQTPKIPQKLFRSHRKTNSSYHKKNNVYSIYELESRKKVYRNSTLVQFFPRIYTESNYNFLSNFNNISNHNDTIRVNENIQLVSESEITDNLYNIPVRNVVNFNIESAETRLNPDSVIKVKSPNANSFMYPKNNNFSLVNKMTFEEHNLIPFITHLTRNTNKKILKLSTMLQSKHNNEFPLEKLVDNHSRSDTVSSKYPSDYYFPSMKYKRKYSRSKAKKMGTIKNSEVSSLANTTFPEYGLLNVSKGDARILSRENTDYLQIAVAENTPIQFENTDHKGNHLQFRKNTLRTKRARSSLNNGSTNYSPTDSDIYRYISIASNHNDYKRRNRTQRGTRNRYGKVQKRGSIVSKQPNIRLKRRNAYKSKFDKERNNYLYNKTTENINYTLPEEDNIQEDTEDDSGTFGIDVNTGIISVLKVR